MEMLISFSSRTLAPAHTAETTSKCFPDNDADCAWLASQHAWPEPHVESMGYFHVRRKMRNSQSNNPDELKAQWSSCGCRHAIYTLIQESARAAVALVSTVVEQ